ncbi:MAG: hypothetical protein P8O16_18575 [Algoriphagus sp.]|uniref:hypothetical protein n=1 Tax=Algoriphagus sp. TaxID=1872435 RepID=UPI002610128E|nr:hypothetical protein [Algoriphagus sp.]MDG1279291.1 hypothetical protein [Algoriphagus sp.]
MTTFTLTMTGPTGAVLRTGGWDSSRSRIWVYPVPIVRKNKIRVINTWILLLILADTNAY